MNKMLVDLYLDWVNNYMTSAKWADDQGISHESAITILRLLKKEYNNYAELVGLQRTDK